MLMLTLDPGTLRLGPGTLRLGPLTRTANSSSGNAPYPTAEPESEIADNYNKKRKEKIIKNPINFN